MNKKNIFIIIGSAGKNSANEKLMNHFSKSTKNDFNVTIFNELKTLPHFEPQLSIDNPPAAIVDFRKAVETADGIIICTPEYIFSIPSGLKNAFEWCVATTVFSDKPVGLITASADGQKGHEELQLILRTVIAKFNNDTTLLIRGIKGKISDDGEIKDSSTEKDLQKFINAFKDLVNEG